MAKTSHRMTLTQKILAAHARDLPRPWVQAGDVLQVSVDWTIASELAWNGMDRTYVLGADSHTSSHGGLGAVSIGLGGADIVVAMVLGTSWIEVPEAISVEYTGQLPFGFGGKEVILRTLALLGRNTVAMERSVEYRGEGVKQLSTDSRFAIANMTAEFGGLNGIFEADEGTAAWLAGRADADDPESVRPMRSFRADPEAPYAARYPVALDRLEPQVAKPFSPDNVVGVSEVAGMPLDGLFIGACTTTEEELVLGALGLEAAEKKSGAKSRRPPQPKQLVAPGGLTIQEDLRRAGVWEGDEGNGFGVGP